MSCQLNSPWLKMVIQRYPQLKVSVILNWDARQFLIDQTLLAKPDLAGVFKPQPLTGKQLYQYLDEYKYLEKALGNKPDTDTAKGIPEDLLWLFRHTGSFNNQMFIQGSIWVLLHERIQHYTQIVKSLVNQCFASQDNTLQQYKTVFDLNMLEGSINLQAYKIKKLRRTH